MKSFFSVPQLSETHGMVLPVKMPSFNIFFKRDRELTDCLYIHAEAESKDTEGHLKK